MNIRRATKRDVSRIAEIIIFNYRINFYPIFQNDAYYFDELQVVSMAEEYARDLDALSNTYVYDDGVIKGVLRMDGQEVKKLFVDPCFQSAGIGEQLLNYAVQNHSATFLWALEKNVRAIRFYQRHGFHLTDQKILEEDTTEYLVKMER